MNNSYFRRRDFIKILGGATVATALPGCTRQKPRDLVPYVIPHDEIVPGKSVWYASVCRECPAGCGIRVRIREGRAVKIEGNPVHPINEGKLCLRGQTALQGLYNPDRIKHPMKRSEDGTWQKLSWDEMESELELRISQLIERGKGQNVSFMTSYQSGSIDRLIDDFLGTFGSTRRLRYELFGYDARKKASEAVFGNEYIPEYNFSDSRYILSFGADFLETWMSPVAHTRQFSKAREVKGEKISDRSGFVYIGPRMSATATKSDEWVQVQPGDEYLIALAMVNHIVHHCDTLNLTVEERRVLRTALLGYEPERVAEQTSMQSEKIKFIATRFATARPGIAVPGGASVDGNSSVILSAAVHLLNYVCGNYGKTVNVYDNKHFERINSYEDILSFRQSVTHGEISALLWYDINPIYIFPSSLQFDETIKQIPLKIAFTSFPDESSVHADYIVPIHTPLESWGDYVLPGDVHGLMQPVMQPVFPTKMFGDVLLRLMAGITGEEQHTFHEYVKVRWKDLHQRLEPEKEFDRFWVESLANGVRWEKVPPVGVRLSPGFRAETLESIKGRRSRDGRGYRLLLYPSLNHYDGRGANKPIAQEISDPITQLSWENWVEINPDDAKLLGVKTGTKVRVYSSYGSVELPVFIYRGTSPGVIAIPVGQGHNLYGRYAKGRGVNPLNLLSPLRLRQSGAINLSGSRVFVENLQEGIRLANVAGSDVQHGRKLLQVMTVDEFIRKSSDAQRSEKEQPKMYPPHPHPDHRWGMVIDLDKCTGCSACVAACYIENNIPAVGKKEITRGRELAWIQVQRFFDDDGEGRHARFLPMLCQQCCYAPCEPVCPVYAAYHTDDGINAQVYNRCIGTRYCANNCPYKVRRFNWFDYEIPEPLNWSLNPDVTVRTKGVMEKCNFCFQRIYEARLKAREEKRPIRDGDVMTACQQTCPAGAIVFGDLNDNESEVNKVLKRNESRSYKLLEELNTEPGIIYLKDLVERTK